MSMFEGPKLTASWNEAMTEEDIMQVLSSVKEELVQGLDGDEALEWLRATQDRFDDLVNDSELNLIRRLDSEDTRTAAMAELRQKLYH